MPADAAETRFPPDKAERALWGLPPHERARTKAGGKRGRPEGLSPEQEPERPVWGM